ncbi:MAG: hypothetical protein QNJ64_08810 [Crocosphaera sp.]|nr:hypothetical protein [Crocosphaera sp.]
MENLSIDNAVKAVTCEINLGKSVLDAYMLPDGEKRIGIENIGVALGYLTSKVFFQRTELESTTLKELKEIGFSGKQIWVKTIGNDDANRKTIGLRDFIKLVTYEAISRRNKKAIILLAIFAETGLEKILEDVFAGKEIDFLLEKIVHYSKWTYEELEEVLTYNRQEVHALYPWSNS